MDKKKTKQENNSKNNEKLENFSEDYGYDFVPTLNEWLNIDEQMEKVDELEDI